MCRCICAGCFKMVKPDLFFPICFQSKNCQLSLVSWKAATQIAQTKNYWKVWELQRRLALQALMYSSLFSQQTCHSTTNRSLLLPLQLSSRDDAKVKQAWSQLCYKVAIWERSANPTANVRSWGQHAEILPAVGMGERGWRCQQAREIRPAAWLLGLVAGRAAAWLAQGSRCTAVQTRARHNTCVSPSPPLISLPFAQRQDSQMLAKLQRTAHSSTLPLKSDQNNHRWLWIGGELCRLFKPWMRHLAIHKTPPVLPVTTGEEIKTWRGVTANCITKHQHTSQLSLFWFFSLATVKRNW